jgi:ABC-type Mn2+/Zn2+ transport system permease subunit
MAQKKPVNRPVSKASNTAAAPKVQRNLIFNKENYLLTIIAFVVVVIGFALMYGTTDIYDFRKTTLAPIVVLAGLGIGIYAIMYKGKASSSDNA